MQGAPARRPTGPPSRTAARVDRHRVAQDGRPGGPPPARVAGRTAGRGRPGRWSARRRRRGACPAPTSRFRALGRPREDVVDRDRSGVEDHRTRPTMANPPASWTQSMASPASRRAVARRRAGRTRIHDPQDGGECEPARCRSPRVVRQPVAPRPERPSRVSDRCYAAVTPALAPRRPAGTPAGPGLALLDDLQEQVFQRRRRVAERLQLPPCFSNTASRSGLQLGDSFTPLARTSSRSASSSSVVTSPSVLQVAVVEDGDAVADVLHVVEPVAAHEDRLALLPQVEDQVLHPPRCRAGRGREVGSSRMTRSGSLISAWARPMRCRMPLEYSLQDALLVGRQADHVDQLGGPLLAHVGRSMSNSRP